MFVDKTLINIADDALYSYQDKYMTDVQRLILSESLLGKSYDEMKGYATEHLKNEGAKLWILLSKALGEKISKSNFQSALARRTSSTFSNEVVVHIGKLLSNDSSPIAIRSFLQRNPNIIQQAFGTDIHSLFFWSCSLDKQNLDICIGKLSPTTGRRTWSIVLFGILSGDIIDSINKLLLEIDSLRIWTSQNLEIARESMPDFNSDFFTHIVAGRRKNLSQNMLKEIQLINETIPGIRVRTYDWLMDIAMSL
jgi:hypothetical protein